MYKLFVGGISQETTEADLRSHFSKFGIITKASIIYDKRTSRPRSPDASKGFGFIESDNKKVIQRIFEVKVHYLKGRYVDINKALDKNSEVPSDIIDRGFKKLFVGGLSSETIDEDLFEYFSAFAPVFKAYVIYDPNTRESKSIRLLI
jgi:RNA recognition motif-containing protein